MALHIVHNATAIRSLRNKYMSLVTLFPSLSPALLFFLPLLLFFRWPRMRKAGVSPRAAAFLRLRFRASQLPPPGVLRAWGHLRMALFQRLRLLNRTMTT